MNKKGPFVGTYRTASFNVKGGIDALDHSLDSYSLIKKDGGLCLVYENSLIELEPVDPDSSALVVSCIDDDILYNRSVYKLIKTDKILNVVAYDYGTNIVKLIDKSRFIKIYLPEEREELYLKARFNKKDGEELPGMSKKQILDDMRKIFINFDSIFCYVDKDVGFNKITILGSRVGKFYISLSATATKRGVYRIDEIKRQMNDPRGLIYQIYNNVDFVEPSSVEDINESKIINVYTDQIYPEWDNYLNFQRKEYQKRQASFVDLKYTNLEKDPYENRVSFTLTSKAKAIDPELLSEGQLRISCRVMEEDGTDYKTLKANLEHLCSCPVNVSNSLEVIYEYTDSEAVGINEILNANTSGEAEYFESSTDGELKRRERTLGQYKRGDNPLSKKITKFMDPKVTDKTLIDKKFEPLDEDTLKALGLKKEMISENYKLAMSTAINTPDIAIIQGPPGAGKTTLIAGIVHKIKRNRGESQRILISSEQHDALRNALDGIAGKNDVVMPALEISSRFGEKIEDSEKELHKRVRAFQNEMLSLCRDVIIKKSGNEKFEEAYKKYLFAYNKMRRSNFSPFVISEFFPNLEESLVGMNLDMRVNAYLSAVKYGIEGRSLPQKQLILPRRINDLNTKISEQRLDIDKYRVDGVQKMKELQSLLEIQRKENHLLPKELREALEFTSISKETLKAYHGYLNILHLELVAPYLAPSEKKNTDFEAVLSHINETVRETIEKRGESIADVMEELYSRLSNISDVVEMVKEYSTIVGSTCAQAGKAASKDGSSIPFDYVIIDEAARSNPIDMLIPLMMGKKAILVGDHKQLPHYIEQHNLDEYEKANKKARTEVLKESIFETLYSNLDRAYTEGRIQVRRTCRLEEQHRMAPKIREFISKQFYDGALQDGYGIENDPSSKDNIYRVFEGANAVFIDVPYIVPGKSKTDGEERELGSLYRQSEINKTINIIKDVVNNWGSLKEKPSIGIISFYKSQIRKINEALAASFPEKVRDFIECGTVDSFQGKQFDIVILSCVRANNESNDPRKRLGFLYDSPSRINVALSRAKRLVVVIGDERTISYGEPKNNHLYGYINYVKEGGGFYGK